jgi:hypothetical protein
VIGVELGNRSEHQPWPARLRFRCATRCCAAADFSRAETPAFLFRIGVALAAFATPP